MTKFSTGIGVKFLLTSASIIVILAGIKAAQDFISPLLLAVFFAIILTPPLRWLKKKGLPDSLAIFTLSTFVFLLGLSILLAFTNSLTRFTEKLPVYTEKITSAYGIIDTKINDITDTFYNLSESISPFSPAEVAGPIEESNEEAANETTIQFQNLQERERLSLGSVIPVDLLAGQVQIAVGRLLQIATVSSLVILMLVFMLIEAARIPDKIKEAFKDRDISNEYLQKIADDTWNYMKIKTIICFLTGLSTTIVLWFLQVDYAILWGLLMFFLNYIPSIGQVLASIPPILLGFLDGGLSLGIWVTVWMIVINSFWGLAIEPRYMGQGLGISSLFILLSLIFWGWLLGPVGMFLSAPLTMVLKIVLQNGPRTKWIAVLLSNR